ncbi:hypothetical protein P7C71_g5516, partial [Lecanoromycetidae sp. Uapishka_2]
MEKKGFFDRITRKTKKKVENHSPGTQQGRGVQKLNVYNTNGVQQQPLVVESEPPDAETTSGGRDLVKSVPTPGSITTKRDFWAEAGKKLGQLKPDVYQKLELAIQEGSNASGTLEERIRLDLSNKIAAITDRQWRIKWGARVNIPMRGLLEGVVKALEKFKDVGSAAASLDPVHAGLPLAAVCVLLPLILNLSSQEEPAKSGLDTISMIVARYAALESVYFQQDSIKLTKNFENTLVDLYAKILEYQAVAACFLGKRTLARYGSAIPKLDDFVGVLKEVQDLDEECIKLIQAIEAEAGRQSGRQLEKLFSLAEKVLAKLQSQCDMNEKIIDWLSDIEYGGDHDRARDTLGVSYAKSGEWFRWVELELKLFLSPKYRMKYWKDVKSSLDVMESHVGKGVPQLNETYDTIYRMNTEGQPHAQALAQRVLKWVLLPLIPHDNPIQQQDASDMVKLDAVIEAISTDTDGIRDPDIDEKFISDICSNLIIFDESTQTLRFAHLSVVEYLQNRVTQNTTPPDNEFSFIHVRAEVAVSCLSWISHSAKSGASQISRDLYLQRPPIQRSYTTIGAVPTLATLQCSLLRFSVLYWHSYCPHTYYGPRENALQKLFSEVMYEERGSQILNFWIDQYKKSCGISLPRLRGHRWMRPGFMQCAPIEDWHMLMLTLSNCHVSDAQFVMRHPVKPGALYSTSGPPSRIFAAAAFGIQSVITCATNAELSEKNVFRQTNLQIAAARGHEKVLKELLECKSVREDINLFSPISDTFWDSGDTGEPVYGYVFRGTALHFAVLSSKDNPQIIKAIINAGADLEAKNDRGETARGMALRLGRWNAMKVLDDCTMNQGKASI